MFTPLVVILLGTPNYTLYTVVLKKRTPSPHQKVRVDDVETAVLVQAGGYPV